MIPINGNILIKFDHDKNSTLVAQDNGIFLPERYVIEEGDQDADTAYGVTTDRKLINPQKVDILSGAHAGKRAFVHYGAFEVCRWVDDEKALIPEKMVLFLIDPIECMPGTYLGEEVFGELPQTASGIYLTPQLEEKEGIKIRITHTPKKSGVLYYDPSIDRCSFIKSGNTVITVDSFQYDLNFEGKKYIKLTDEEIIGIETKGGYLPIGDTILVEYLPDESQGERIAENDRRRAQRDYIDKHFIHISEGYTKGLDPNYLDLPEPKFINATIIAIGDKVKPGQANVGDSVLVFRNYGCILPNKQWILKSELVVWVVKDDEIKQLEL